MPGGLLRSRDRVLPHNVREGEIAAEIHRLRHGDSRYNLILLGAILAGLGILLMLPDRPFPAAVLATLIAGWEVRAWIDRRAASLQEELEAIQARELSHYRLHMRSGRRGPPPRLR